MPLSARLPTDDKNKLQNCSFKAVVLRRRTTEPSTSLVPVLLVEESRESCRFDDPSKDTAHLCTLDNRFVPTGGTLSETGANQVRCDPARETAGVDRDHDAPRPLPNRARMG